MANLVQDYIEVIEKMLQLMELAVSQESEKRKALLDHDTDQIEVHLQGQQATTMKLENLEKRRMALAQEVGFGSRSPEEIVAMVEGEDAQRLSSLFQQMRVTADQLRTLNRASIEIARMELKWMGSTVPGSNAGKAGGLYNQSGKRGPGLGGSSFEEKI